MGAVLRPPSAAAPRPLPPCGGTCGSVALVQARDLRPLKPESALRRRGQHDIHEHGLRAEQQCQSAHGGGGDLRLENARRQPPTVLSRAWQ